MTRFSEVLGRPVIARDTATEVGRVSRFVVGTDARIHAITVGEAPSAALAAPVPVGIGGFALPEPMADPAIVLDWDQVVGFGPDAVVAPSASVLRPAADDVERAAVAGRDDLPGRTLLTDGGDIIGTIEDVDFDTATGQLSGFIVGDRSVEVPRIVASGRFGVIVPA